MPLTRFVLASQSPRRRELLGLCGYPFDIIVAEVDENSVSHPDPAQDCIQTAQLKANAIRNQFALSSRERLIVIAADTVVALDGQLLGKPKDTDEAHYMLVKLRDRTHQVHTGVVIKDLGSGQEELSSHTAVVTMRAYSEQEIYGYVASGDPLDKAGAYAIQNPRFKPVDKLDGCYLGVMGLSICHLLQLLEQFDLPFQTDLCTLDTVHQNYPCPIFNKIAQKHGK